MQLLKILAIVVAAAVVAGCSVRYAPRVPGFVPGYVDRRLGEDTFQVRVGEAWPKDWQDLEKFAMYRAAELTRANGSRYFAVLNASSRTNTHTIRQPSTSNTTGTISTYGSTSYINAATTTTGGGATAISGGWYTLDFEVIDDSKIADYRDVVDSQQVFRNLQYFIESRR